MPERIRISPTLSIPEEEITESFVRASGPGGQNVNKVSSAVVLRFDAMASDSLPSRVKAKLRRIGGHLLTQDGVIVIHADGHRSQRRNREDALARLVDLLRDASAVEKRRIATRPTLGSKRRRLESKTKRGAIKSARRKPDPSRD